LHSTPLALRLPHKLFSLLGVFKNGSGHFGRFFWKRRGRRAAFIRRIGINLSYAHFGGRNSSKMGTEFDNSSKVMNMNNYLCRLLFLRNIYITFYTTVDSQLMCICLLTYFKTDLMFHGIK